MNLRDCLLKKNPGNAISLYWQGESERIISFIEREVRKWDSIRFQMPPWNLLNPR